jgi:hypothetical protein
LLTLGITVAASTVWQILREAGIAPFPDRTSRTWASFLRPQAHTLLAADFIETMTLTGTRMYILVVIEHATRRIRILVHPARAGCRERRVREQPTRRTQCRHNVDVLVGIDTQHDFALGGLTLVARWLVGHAGHGRSSPCSHGGWRMAGLGSGRRSDL